MDDIAFARIMHRKDTEENWGVYDPVILDGEIILIDTGKGVIRTKIGNGTEKYSELPFHDCYDRITELENNVAELMPFEVLKFSHDKGVKEIGDKVFKYSLTWEFNKKPVSVYLNNKLLDESEKIGTHIHEESPFVSQGIRTTTKWEIEGIDDRGKSAKKSTTLYFYHGVYYGTSKKPDSITRDFILSLSDKVLSGTKNRTVPIKGGAEKYFYYAYPKSYGESIFHIGGLDYTYEKEEIMFENKFGVKEPYYIYVSEEPMLNNISITVK